MGGISTGQVHEFQRLFLDRMRTMHQDVLDGLSQGKYDEVMTAVLEETAAQVVKTMV
jgi:hypothetical protein